MLPRYWQERLEDILESLLSIQNYTEGMTRKTFAEDRKTVRAVAYEIGVIGEAASRIPPEVRERYPEVPWENMRAIRNVVIHQYFEIDEFILWDTITEDLPPLVPMLQDILEREQ